MSFKQLYDHYTQSVYTIDNNSMSFKLTSEELNLEFRLKPYSAAIIFALFKEHPRPLLYSNLRRILKKSGFSYSDDTRLHRKVSELRSLLTKKSPSMKELIKNTRSLGYSLPIHFKEPTTFETPETKIIKNQNIKNIFIRIQELINLSTELTSKIPIIKNENLYTLKRSLVSNELEKIVAVFNKCQKNLLKELKLHPVDMEHIRLELILSKIKTYIGLSRLSEFSITKEQWIEWHQSESNRLLSDLLDLIKSK